MAEASIDDVAEAAVLEATSGSELGPGIVDHWLSEPVRPTAVIASNDVIAFGIISELGTRGFTVPTDVSVIGFDGLDLGAQINPRLTSVRQPITGDEGIAIERGNALIAGEPADHVVLEPSLLIRSSTWRI